MRVITFKLSDEEIRQLEFLQKLRGETGSIHRFCKRIIQEYIQGRIRSLAIEKSLKEVSLELEALRKILLDLQLKLEESTRDHEVKELLEEILEKIEKFQGQTQGQSPGTSEDTLNLLIALKELGMRVLLLSDKRKEFEIIIDGLIQKYKGGAA